MKNFNKKNTENKEKKIIKKSKTDLDDFWSDCEVNPIQNVKRKHSPDMKNNFHTPAFTNIKINSDFGNKKLKINKMNNNNKVSNINNIDNYSNNIRDYSDHSYEKEENAKEEKYATFDINEAKDTVEEIQATIQKTETSSNGNNKLEKFQNLLKKFDMDEESVLNYIKGGTINSEQKRAPERCYLLYEKGMIKNEMMRALHEKNNEIKAQQEMIECTFKPSIIKSFKRRESLATQENISVIHNINDISTVYERNKNWVQQKKDKLFKERNLKNKQDEFSHKPQLNKSNLDVIFSQERTLQNDPKSMKFVGRLENARKEQENKKKRVTADLSKVAEKKWGKGLRVRSASMDNTSILLYDQQNTSMGNIKMMKRNLHDELHAISIYNEIEDN